MSEQHRGPTIIISDDDDDDNQDDFPGAPFGREYRQLIDRFWELGQNQHNAIIIDDDDGNSDEFQNQQVVAEQDLEPEIAQFIDFDDGDWHVPKLNNVTRNHPVQDHLRIPIYHHNGKLMKEGTVVEINQLPQESFGVQFLEIQMVRKEGDRVVLRGIPFARARNLRGLLPLKRNEVVSILDIHEDDGREWSTQAAIEVSIDDVLRIRQLQFTNAAYPSHRYKLGVAEEHAVLTCRFKMVSFYKSAAAAKKGRLHSREIKGLRAHEVPDDKLRVLDDHLLNRWRGGKVRGGSSSRAGPEVPVINLIDDKPPKQSRMPDQTYTHGDFFCGAGGVTRGAKDAGFITVIACDIDPNACATYRLNFPSTNLYEMSVHGLVTSISGYPIDVIHISPPCQVWSPAHTSPGQNDDANLAALYACIEVLDKFRPRIVTVEQTFGLLHSRFKPFFNKFVQCFTENNYSIAYRVMNLAEISSSQNRKRLIMIASCPVSSFSSYFHSYPTCFGGVFLCQQESSLLEHDLELLDAQWIT